jgi:pimeloyl-ACP methyl ester carboxylesterase
VFGLPERLRDAATDTEAIARVHDLRFALDRVLDGPLGPRLDAARVVAAGHSYGANTTLLAAGARVVRDGAAVPLRDERVRAAIVISAPPFYGERSFAPILGGIEVPSLHVTATADDIRIPGFWSGVDDRIAVFDAIGGRPKALAVFEGGSHSIFTDRGGTGGPALNPQVKAATRELSVAFLRRVFDGDAAPLLQWPTRHAGIVARFSALGA